MSETSKAKLRILLASSPYGGSLHEKLVEYLQASDEDDLGCVTRSRITLCEAYMPGTKPLLCRSITPVM